MYSSGVSQQLSASVPSGWTPPNIKNDPRYVDALCKKYKTKKEVDECKKTISDTEIWNGNRVTDREIFKNVVAVVIYITKQDGEFIDTKLCSGVLVNPNSVLTARHCLEHTSTNFDISELEASRNLANIKEVVFGLHHEIAYDPGQVPERDRIDVLGCAAFPDLNYEKCVKIVKRNAFEKRSAETRDLMLLKLAKSVIVDPAILATRHDWKSTSSGTIVGFGVTEDVYQHGQKREAETVVISPSCVGSYDAETDSDVYGCIPAIEMVAGGINNPTQIIGDTCTGDSGGPFFVETENVVSGGTDYHLAGITSRAIQRPKDNTTVPYCGFGGVTF